MTEVILYAIPAFVVLLVIEVFVYRRIPEGIGRGYATKDTRTSLTMGAGSVVIGAGWKLVLLAVYTGVYELTPLRIPSNTWWAWVLILFAEDLCYYWFHRVHHEVRLFWASHVVHHSSQHYNLSTALRQSWTPMTGLPFWLPLLLLGFPPWMVFVQQSVSLIYQFWIHTERIGTLARPIELVMNTPSHHRVHHGSNAEYLDRNYAGIFIIWDRLFGTFEPERAPVEFGLTKNLKTYSPLRVAFHEFAAIGHDIRSSTSWRDRLSFALRGPGWEPSAYDAGRSADAVGA